MVMYGNVGNVMVMYGNVVGIVCVIMSIVVQYGMQCAI